MTMLLAMQTFHATDHLMRMLLTVHTFHATSAPGSNVITNVGFPCYTDPGYGLPDDNVKYIYAN